MKKFYIAKARRLRGTPFSSRIENQGLTAYTVYNHMLLPAGFEGTAKEYSHLKTTSKSGMSLLKDKFR